MTSAADEIGTVESAPSGEPAPQRGVSARSLLFIVIALAVIGGLVLLGIWFFSPRDLRLTDDVEFVYLADEDTATVGFAGVFPAGGSVLAAPTGMAGDGESIFVAERDAGQIARFTYGGGLVETLAVPPAEGRDTATPISVAVVSDGSIAIVDSASGEVVLMDPGSPDEATRIESGAVLQQPTSVSSDGDRIIVAEASTGTFEVFDLDGVHLESLGADLDPRPTFVGGLEIAGTTMYASDSNAGRVLLLSASTGAQTGTLQERIGLPRGIAVDGTGRVMVADTFDGIVLVFDADDYMLADTVGDDETRRVEEGGLLGAPQGLVWDQQTRLLYVADASQGKIKVYEVRAGR